MKNEIPAQRSVCCLAYFVLALKKMYLVKNFICFFCNYFFLRQLFVNMAIGNIQSTRQLLQQIVRRCVNASFITVTQFKHADPCVKVEKVPNVNQILKPLRNIRILWMVLAACAPKENVFQVWYCFQFIAFKWYMPFTKVF